MRKIIIYLFYVLTLINSSFCIGGDCEKVRKKAKNFESCRGIKPADPDNEYCCFLKAGKIQECVELLKVDIDNNNVKRTIKELEKGVYEYWDDGSVDINEIYGDIKSLVCDEGFYISNKLLINMLFIFLIIF